MKDIKRLVRWNIDFVETNPGKKVLITSEDKLLDAIDGKTGTLIY